MRTAYTDRQTETIGAGLQQLCTGQR